MDVISEQRDCGGRSRRDVKRCPTPGQDSPYWEKRFVPAWADPYAYPINPRGGSWLMDQRRP